MRQHLRLLVSIIVLTVGLGTKAFAQPANNTCTNAQTVTPNGTCVPGTTVNATDTWTGVVGCQSGNSGSNHPEVWYSFTATGTGLNLTVTAGTLTGDLEFILAQGTCGGTMTIIGSQCGPSPLNGSISGLTLGQVYYYTISSNTQGSANAGTFTTCITSFTPAAPPANDQCSAAQLIALSGSTQVSPGHHRWGSR